VPLSNFFVVDQSNDGHGNTGIFIVTDKYLFIITRKCATVVLIYNLYIA